MHSLKYCHYFYDIVNNKYMVYARLIYNWHPSSSLQDVQNGYMLFNSDMTVT